MSTQRWDELLVNEHEMIERAMDIVRRELEKLPGKPADQFALKRSLDFLLAFGDRIHNTKEEKWLFPLLVERGVPEDGPIRVMLMEHASERALLADMVQKTPKLPGMSAADQALFKGDGLEYLEIRANHIWKENDVLYAMGRRDFSEQDNTDLVDAFNQYSASIYGPDFAAILAKMLAEVEQGGAARKSLIENLSYEQIDAIMETLPFEVTFVDADDAVAYFNRLDKEKIFVRSRSVIGRKVLMCHPAKSVDQVKQIVAGFKNGSLDKAEFWIAMGDNKIYIRYFPVRNDQGQYMGVLEVTQEIGAIQKITGEKRLL
jgi:uncharacterized protein